MERELQKHSWINIKKLVPNEIDTVIIPIGTIEAHGSACLGTDNYIPEAIAQGIADRINALIAPTVNYGITRSLYRYNGSLSIRPETFGPYVHDILDSLVDSGFKNIIVMNGHGGNNSSLKDAAVRFHQERRANIAVIHWWQLCDKMTREFFGHPGGHAGTDETAMVQAVDPNLADKDLYDKDLAYYCRPGADIYPVPGTILLYEEGQGYPNFDLEQAAQYKEKVIEAVGEFAQMVLDRWRKFDL